MPYKEPPKEHQIKEGEVRNPNGRPKGSLNMTTLIKQYLEQKDPKTNKYIKDIVSEAFVKRAVAKSDVLMKELLDRTDGKVVQKNEIEGKINVTGVTINVRK